MIKKIIVIVAIIVGVVAVVGHGVYEKNKIEKNFIIKKEKVLKVVNGEIEKRNNLNKKMEKLAKDFNCNYDNNLNDNLIILKDKIEKATTEKELLNIINN